ncbi:hypothetical protein CAPTEDRAFT_198086 [Capitella teleta]|uniref:Tyrosine-protein phosphatase domain-containing protein n=1 Tax=Capitella teleta TaxID=283909 RepID=X1ZYA0_CAPTE|nr:hypothetical protein CAPTEDRAFT_198086 [Capitella teleta]|eukprot:ELU04636.1 hypothetical protein CAPTEDRAFT_198086 [Capitella teleta]
MRKIILLLVLHCVVVDSAEVSCVYGDGCLFPCRCNSGTTCDANSGSCSDSKCRDGYPRPTNNQDRYNWAGSACQIGNVAYGKPTNQSGTYKEYVSSRGVDGILGNPNNNRDCAHPDNPTKKAAWFYVDLGSVHEIFNVTVYNTYNGGVCPAGKIGDYCLKTCDVGSFGVECQEQCGRCRNESCSAVDGSCSDGCDLWFVGDLCKEEIGNSTLHGFSTYVKQEKDSSIAITWMQDSNILENQTQYFGYTVAYAKGSDEFVNGPSVAHKTTEMKQTLFLDNIESYVEYSFIVRPYREMRGERQYGWPSDAITMQFSTVTDNTAMITGVTVGLLIIITLVCVAGIMFIRRRNPNLFSKGTFKDYIKNSEAQIVDEGGERIEAGVQRSFKSKPKVEAREPVKTEDEGTKLSLRQLERYITKTNDVPDGFKDEYKKLPKPGIGECKVGSKPENRTKNRFGNIKPFDANRVLLDADDMSQSDYVNASYITARFLLITKGLKCGVKEKSIA